MDENTLYIERTEWLEEYSYGDSVKSSFLADYTISDLTLEDIREAFEDCSTCSWSEDIKGSEDEFISDVDALAELKATESTLSRLSDKLSKLVKELDALESEAQKEGLHIRDFGRDLLRSMDNYGWNTSSWFC